MSLYYIIIAFGGLLLLFTVLSMNKTRKLVTPYQTKNKKNIGRWLLNGVTGVGKKWLGFFTHNNPKNLPRSTLIALVVAVALFVLNRNYLRVGDLSFIGITLALIFVVVWFWGKRRSRKIFEDSFPEVIQIVNAAISAGIGILQALERCGENIQGDFGTEFKNIYKRISIGEEVDSVFFDSYQRYPYKEYYYFITIIKLNLSRGGQLKEVINRLARIIADSKKMEKRKSALTSEARMSAMIVACFPIGFMIFMRFMMPQDFEFLLNNPSGRMVFYYVVGSEMLGMFIIWMLMRKAT